MDWNEVKLAIGNKIAPPFAIQGGRYLLLLFEILIIFIIQFKNLQLEKYFLSFSFFHYLELPSLVADREVDMIGVEVVSCDWCVCNDLIFINHHNPDPSQTWAGYLLSWKWSSVQWFLFFLFFYSFLYEIFEWFMKVNFKLWSTINPWVANYFPLNIKELGWKALTMDSVICLILSVIIVVILIEE